MELLGSEIKKPSMALPVLWSSNEAKFDRSSLFKGH